MTHVLFTETTEKELNFFTFLFNFPPMGFGFKILFKVLKCALSHSVTETLCISVTFQKPSWRGDLGHEWSCFLHGMNHRVKTCDFLPVKSFLVSNLSLIFPKLTKSFKLLHLKTSKTHFFMSLKI